MLFNSYIFILLFLPICLAGYFILNHRKKYTLAQAFLMGMSFWFYGYFNPSYLIIMLCSICGNFFITQLMRKATNPALRKYEMILAVLLNLGVLFVFKYYDFFVSTMNALIRTDFTLYHLVLPLGISFFTFQQVSYVIDTYRGEVPEYTFLQYASFVVYFPQLIAGPIVTHDELIPQFADLSKKQFNWDNFARGIFMFTLGLAKKVLIADVFGNAANWGFSTLTNTGSLDTTNAILCSLAYTLQIYFDFSGYCDMAIGIGQMMNIELPLNFNSPYKAYTITEFWQRWHITLTRFFTKYIYIPLGGNRKGKYRTYLNILIVFLASGLWHGANWTFILWGLLHGLFSVTTRHLDRFFKKLHPVLCWMITFVFVNFTWILFRANSIFEGIKFIKQILKFDFSPIAADVVNAFNLPELLFLFERVIPFDLLNRYPNLLLMAYFTVTFCMALSGRNAYERMQTFKPGFLNFILISILFVMCVLSFSGISTFLYFNF